ncbi:MAG: DUF3792 family protein [Acidimicrobiales bacterium]
MSRRGDRPARPGLFDWNAIGVGAALALAVAVPVIVTSSVVGIDVDSNMIFVAFLLYLAGQTLGGWLAGRRCPDAPLANGAMAAIAAYAVLGVVATVIRVARGEPLDPGSLILNAFLAASAGLLGGLIATWRRPSASDAPPDTGRPGARPG